MTIFSFFDQHIIAVLILIGLCGVYLTVRANRRYGLKGVYGWLLFFVLILAFTAYRVPLQTFVLYGLLRYASPALETLDNMHMLYKLQMALAWLESVICVYLIYILLTKKVARTIKTVILGIWIGSIGVGLLQTAILMIFSITLSALALPNVLWTMFFELGFCVVWTLYFQKSKRVKNTYPEMVQTNQ